MTDLRQAAQQALDAWDDPAGMKDLCVAMDALRSALEQQAEPVHGDIRALKYRIHELEGEVMGYKRMLDVAEAASQPQQQAEPVDGNTLLKAFLAAAKEAGVTHLQQAKPVQETEAFGFVTVRRLSQRFENHHDQYQFYPAGQIPYLDNVDECHTVYTTPPQRKPLTDEDWKQIADMPDTFDQGVAWAQARLKEKNDLHKD